MSANPNRPTRAGQPAAGRSRFAPTKRRPRRAPGGITYGEAIQLCDRATVDEALAMGRHHHSDGDPPEPFWADEGEFAECIATAEFELRDQLRRRSRAGVS